MFVLFPKFPHLAKVDVIGEAKYPDDSSDGIAQATKLTCLVFKLNAADVHEPYVKRECIDTHMTPSNYISEALNTCKYPWPCLSLHS